MNLSTEILRLAQALALNGCLPPKNGATCAASAMHLPMIIRKHPTSDLNICKPPSSRRIVPWKFWPDSSTGYTSAFLTSHTRNDSSMKNKARFALKTDYEVCLDGMKARVTSINRAPQQAYANAERFVTRHPPEWVLSSEGGNPAQSKPWTPAYPPSGDKRPGATNASVKREDLRTAERDERISPLV